MRVFRYTYGKAVKGEATISVYPTIYSEIIQPIYQNPLRKVVPIDGKTVVEFDVAKDLKWVLISSVDLYVWRKTKLTYVLS